MENLEQILALWDKDSVIDQTEPGKELLKIPTLHNRYLRILVAHRAARQKLMYNYNRMKKLKHEYYSGKMDEDELSTLGWEPFRYVLKSDITTYIESDDDLIKILEKKMYHDEMISVCESIMKEISGRNWTIKSFIDWERFIAGN